MAYSLPSLLSPLEYSAPIVTDGADTPRLEAPRLEISEQELIKTALATPTKQPLPVSAPIDALEYIQPPASVSLETIEDIRAESGEAMTDIGNIASITDLPDVPGMASGAQQEITSTAEGYVDEASQYAELGQEYVQNLSSEALAMVEQGKAIINQIGGIPGVAMSIADYMANIVGVGDVLKEENAVIDYLGGWSGKFFVECPYGHKAGMFRLFDANAWRNFMFGDADQAADAVRNETFLQQFNWCRINGTNGLSGTEWEAATIAAFPVSYGQWEGLNTARVALQQQILQTAQDIIGLGSSFVQQLSEAMASGNITGAELTEIEKEQNELQALMQNLAPIERAKLVTATEASKATISYQGLMDMTTEVRKYRTVDQIWSDWAKFWPSLSTAYRTSRVQELMHTQTLPTGFIKGYWVLFTYQEKICRPVMMRIYRHMGFTTDSAKIKVDGIFDRAKRIQTYLGQAIGGNPLESRTIVQLRYSLDEAASRPIHAIERFCLLLGEPTLDAFNAQVQKAYADQQNALTAAKEAAAKEVAARAAIEAAKQEAIGVMESALDDENFSSIMGITGQTIETATLAPTPIAQANLVESENLTAQGNNKEYAYADVPLVFDPYTGGVSKPLFYSGHCFRPRYL